jgi:hypothetical protein
MTRLLVIGFLLAVLSVPATVHGGEEPTAFAGTPCMDRASVPEINIVCPTTSSTASGDRSFLGSSLWTTTLQGYVIKKPGAEATAFRAAVLEKFGPPTTSSGSFITWTWPSGTEAALQDKPIHRAVMPLLLTKASHDRAGADAKKQREQIKKGF